MPRFDLPEMLSVFPLPGALLLPRARLPLHVFEPRYLAMLDDCLKTEHRLIGMIQPHPDKAADGRGVLHDVGCAGRLTAFSETEDGRYMVSLTGVSRFRVAKLIEGFTPYLRCEADWAPFVADRGGAERDAGFDRAGFLAVLKRYFARNGLSTDWEALGQADDELLINSMSMLSPLEVEDKQALLEAPTLEARRQTLVALMDFALLSGSGTEETRQ
jgi:uncharacterized protein